MSYYKRKSNKEILVLDRKISNGFILTKLDEESGAPICNDCYQVYVSEYELKKEFDEVKFTVAVSIDKDVEEKFIKLFRKVMYQLSNYGWFEDYAEEARNIDMEAGIIREVLFSDHYKKEHFMDIVRSQFSEDFADEIDFSETHVVFDFIGEFKNEVRAIMNQIKKYKDSV